MLAQDVYRLVWVVDDQTHHGVIHGIGYGNTSDVDAIVSQRLADVGHHARLVHQEQRKLCFDHQMSSRFKKSQFKEKDTERRAIGRATPGFPMICPGPRGNRLPEHAE